jgi:uncharacterized membrane protein
MKLDPAVAAAIAAMALATYATRAAGLYLLRGTPVEGRLKVALEALPPAILMAVIAPVVLTSGPAETIAALIAAAAVLFRLPLVAVIVLGVASVVALRMFLS